MAKTESEVLWEKHAIAVGKIAMAWNNLQEILGELFADLFARSEWHKAIAAWHSLTSDVAQQEMLRAVSLVRFGNASKAYTEINWLLEKLKQHTSHQRNFGVHTPFMILHHLDKSIGVLPFAHAGNRKVAAFLQSGNDALKEFAEYEAEIRKLVSCYGASAYPFSRAGRT